MATVRPDPLFPIFLRLQGRKAVLVGGGEVAAGKYAGLRAAGARVTVVAPRIGAELRAHGTDGAEIHERAFQPDDLEGAWFVVSAAPAEVNRAVVAAAEPRRLFVNAVDDPVSGTAYGAGVVTRGGVTVAISTGGGAPALAGLLREAIDEVLPGDVADWHEEAVRLRRLWRDGGAPVPMAARRPLLLDALVRRYERKQKP